MAKPFSYKGVKITPLRKFNPKEDFHYVTRRLSDIGIHNIPNKRGQIKDWNHEDFYKAAITSNPENNMIDIFEMKKGGETIEVVPCQSQLFAYES